MNITVIVPSRGRPLGLAGILSSLRMLESGAHKVTYAVACDEDDVDTIEMCKSLMDQLPLRWFAGSRPVSLGGLVNEIALKVPADVYTAVCDDVLCVTMCWDAYIAEAVEKKPYGVFWWKNALPAEAFWAIVTEKWRAAAGGIFTDHYPFWYDDLCLVELWIMATNEDPQGLEIFLADRPVKTMRLREVKFWRSLFTKTRAWRVKHGREIALKLGLPTPRLSEEFARQWTDILGEAPDEHCERIQDIQGDPGPPDPSYLIARSRAEKILAQC